jgi:hypothetical protein
MYLTIDCGRTIMRLLSISAAAILFVIPAISHAAECGAPPPRTIVVDANAEVSAAPDFVTLGFGVDTRATTAAEAVTKNAKVATDVMAALKTTLAGKGTISFSGYSLGPEYKRNQNGFVGKIIGYNAQNTVRVETAATNLVGALIDAATDAGANRVDSIGFAVKNDAELKNQANTTAAQTARAKARVLASALDVKLGPLLTVTTNAEQFQQPVGFTRMALHHMGAPETPIEPGTISLVAHVTLTYEIQ